MKTLLSVAISVLMLTGVSFAEGLGFYELREQSSKRALPAASSVDSSHFDRGFEDSQNSTGEQGANQERKVGPRS